MECRLVNLSQVENLEGLWRTLEADCDCSFFVSWDWVGLWLEMIGQDVGPLIAMLYCDQELVGLGAFVKNCQRRRLLIQSRRWYLSQTGDKAKDALFIEHNGLLVRRGLETEAWCACLSALMARDDCDEVVLGGIDEPLLQTIREASGGKFGISIENKLQLYVVDLEKIRSQAKDYVALLSSNARRIVKRSYEAAAKNGLGALSVVEPTNLETARDMFADMVRLHAARWQQKGEPGAFSNPFFLKFHQALLERCFEKGIVQLLGVWGGKRLLGVLYNFMSTPPSSQVVVHQYQAGFDLSAQEVRAGLLSHVEAIRYSLGKGYKAYDLMAGDSQYKRSLATERGERSGGAYWVAIQKPNLLFQIEGLARRALRATRHLIRRVYHLFH